MSIHLSPLLFQTGSPWQAAPSLQLLGDNRGTNARLKESNCSTFLLFLFYSEDCCIFIRSWWRNTHTCTHTHACTHTHITGVMTAGEQNWSKKTFCKGELHLLQVKHAAVRAALPQQWETQPGTRTATLFRASFPTPAAALAQHCGSLKALSLWNVPDFQRKKELLRGRQTGKMVCKPTQARPASSLL